MLKIFNKLENKNKVYVPPPLSISRRLFFNCFLVFFLGFTEITALDESILFELVDRIEVGEARKVNGQRICDVKVVYRYVGSVDDALAQERLEAYEKAI